MHLDRSLCAAINLYQAFGPNEFVSYLTEFGNDCTLYTRVQPCKWLTIVYLSLFDCLCPFYEYYYQSWVIQHWVICFILFFYCCGSIIWNCSKILTKKKINFLGPAISSLVTDSEEPHPSLSDWHDYEPQLEFDDTELTHAPDSSKIYVFYMCFYLLRFFFIIILYFSLFFFFAYKPQCNVVLIV